MTQNNTMNKLEQIRQALENAQVSMRHYAGFELESVTKSLAIVNTLIADCSAVDVDALGRAWELNTDPELNRDKEMAFIGKYKVTFQSVIDDAARACLELMKGKE